MDERLNLRRFGPFTLDVTNGVLTRNGARIPLQPQPMTVLAMLASRAGELVTRKELQDAIWPDGTSVDRDQGLNWCIKRIRELLGDDAEHPRFIETVPRKGYRFIPTEEPMRLRRARWAFTASVVVVVCLAITWAHPRSVTVVILPFDNFSGDARNEITANSITEDVINRVGSTDPLHLKVIDRLTAAKFKRTNECIIHIGRALHADFVIEGSVQKRHTTAALYRVANNTQVWATAVSRSDSAPDLISAKIIETFVPRR